MSQKQNEEILNILQEECAEVIQAVSKVARFGFEHRWPDETSQSNRECLEQEVGDVLAMVKLMIDFGMVKEENLQIWTNRKIEKLKKWSKIFDEN